MRLLLSCIFLISAMQVTAKEKDSCDWLLIYYAPYDNNLSNYSDSILAQLQTARHFENVRVVFQVDIDDSAGMYRYTIGADGTTVDTIASELSTSKNQLSNYFDWVKTSHAYKNAAVFFLDHGGGLDEVGQDLQPDSTFLKTKDIRKSLIRFTNRGKNKIDLLYLQVCAKASIEPLYEFHDIAHYTLASQQLLGAPNYYYEATIKFLSENPNSNGKETAKTIAANDRSEMITSLTCIDNRQFYSIRRNFLLLVRQIRNEGQISLVKEPLHFDYSQDRYWDLIDFLNCLDLQSHDAITTRDTIVERIKNDLIAFYFTTEPTTSYSGLSIASVSKDRNRAYWHMKFFRKFWMHRLPLD